MEDISGGFGGTAPGNKISPCNLLNITENKRVQYEGYVYEHGPTSKGVGWGVNEGKNAARYRNFLDILTVFPAGGSNPSLLDVGCGYGELFRKFIKNHHPVDYSGIDVSGAMIRHARSQFGGMGAIFHEGDFFKYADRTTKKYDYVVCNGILTDIPKASNRLEMNHFSKQLIRTMFSLANIGIAFNYISNQVDFFEDHLFYKSPVETLAWCLEELSPIVELRHSLPRYEFTVYVGKPEWNV